MFAPFLRQDSLTFAQSTISQPKLHPRFQLLITASRTIVKPIFLQSAGNSAKMNHGNRQIRKSAVQLIEPELTLVRQVDGPDPRLVELVRLLARRAAREVFEEQIKGRPVSRS
jgi:hypothetical protein